MSDARPDGERPVEPRTPHVPPPPAPADRAGDAWALGFVRPYWRPLVLVLVLSLISTGLALVVPFLSRELVDRALLGGNMRALLWIVAGFLAITAATFVLNVASGLRYTRVSAEILFDMRLALFEHLQRLSPRFYARMPLGQIASRINSDIGEIQRVAAEVALSWVGQVVFLIGSVAILLILDPILFAVSLLVLPPALWALVGYRKRLEVAVAETRDRSARVGSFLIESLLGMKVLVSLNAQGRAVTEFRGHNRNFVEAMMKMRRLTYLSGGLPGLLLAIGSAAILLIGGYRVVEGAITMGTLVAFLAYQMRLLGPVQGLMGLYTSVASARVSLRRVREILDTVPEVTDPDNVGATDLTGRTRGAVRLESVRFTFDRGAPVLAGVTLEIAPGEHVALVGASGEGKSTIADLLARHFDPDEGRILLDGRDLKSMPLAQVRRSIVVVDQDAFVFHASLAENLRYARPSATDADLRDVIEASGLAGFVSTLPEGMQTLVGERGRALSTGERQRLAIARAMLADPAVLVLDEATAGLDPATEGQVLAGYERLMNGRTTLVITHRLEMARRIGRVVVLAEGRVR
ncbi:MAG: ABC transporter ATP-binding protein [Gemmatimonadota bacterium]